jgi:hypothetical protein
MIERQVRATLPGSIFKRGRRWWWKVQLPGETKAKSQPLIPEGERHGATNLKQANAVALAMWQLAVAREAERVAREKARIRAIRKAAMWKRKVRQARQEAEKAAAKQREALEEKIEAYGQQAESWKQKLQEARAEVHKAVLVQKNRCARRMRAYKASAASARQRAIARISADANKVIDRQRSEFERRIEAYKRTMTRIWEKQPGQTRTEAKAKDTPKKTRSRRKTASRKTTRKTRRRKSAKVEQKSGAPAVVGSAAPPQAGEQASTHSEIRMRSEAELDKIITSIRRIAYCECCFGNGIPEGALVRIDSGQRLCPTCMKALEAKEAEMDRAKQLPA